MICKGCSEITDSLFTSSEENLSEKVWGQQDWAGFTSSAANRLYSLMVCGRKCRNIIVSSQTTEPLPLSCLAISSLYHYHHHLYFYLILFKLAISGFTGYLGAIETSCELTTFIIKCLYLTCQPSLTYFHIQYTEQYQHSFEVKFFGNVPNVSSIFISFQFCSALQQRLKGKCVSFTVECNPMFTSWLLTLSVWSVRWLFLNSFFCFKQLPSRVVGLNQNSEFAGPKTKTIS